MAQPGAPSARSVAKIKRILTMLDDHAGQSHALSELAAMAAMSRSYFSRTFRAVAGVPLRDYLRNLKLKRALELVLTSGRSLTDIAVESGFYDLPHLDKAFRQRFDMSPYDFRVRHTVRPEATRHGVKARRHTVRKLVKRDRTLQGAPDGPMRETAAAALAAFRASMRPSLGESQSRLLRSNRSE
ncbi:MAG: hypothetical protein DMD96_33165 [Candidatus Rokuibacteriota bacterium]|nr:MAG: hypothetical protein DMD96_33165 [Candidatus Rokubacteria bacterium]